MFISQDLLCEKNDDHEKEKLIDLAAMHIIGNHGKIYPIKSLQLKDAELANSSMAALLRYAAG